MNLDNFWIFECPKCKMIKDEASVLPCGIFCEDCADAILSYASCDSKEFWCSVCDEIHLIPKKGIQKHYFKKTTQINKELELLKLNLYNCSKRFFISCSLIEIILF